MIEIKINPKCIDVATKESIRLGKLNNSITKGEGNIAGIIGEMMVSYYLKIKRENTYEYDLISPDLKKYDVKTKRCSYKPESNFTVSVCALNITQKCDGYIFVRINNNLSIGWILGYMPKIEYFNNAKFCKKDDIDPDGNGWKFKEDCYNMYIKDLNDINQLKNVNFY